jgi:hypothetical protein
VTKSLIRYPPRKRPAPRSAGAHFGAALLPGVALPAFRNLLYFNGSAIMPPLLVLAAWAAAGTLALALAALRRPYDNSDA